MNTLFVAIGFVISITRSLIKLLSCDCKVTGSSPGNSLLCKNRVRLRTIHQMVGPLPGPCVCGSFSVPGCPFFITRSLIFTWLPSAYIKTKGAWFAGESSEERKAFHSYKKSSWHIGNNLIPYLWIIKSKTTSIYFCFPYARSMADDIIVCPPAILWQGCPSIVLWVGFGGACFYL